MKSPIHKLQEVDVLYIDITQDLSKIQTFAQNEQHFLNNNLELFLDWWPFRLTLSTTLFIKTSSYIFLLDTL